MACNAWNHPANCDCDFRGGHGNSLVLSTKPTNQKPFTSLQSYVNPNARCPVCHEPVYFYQSPTGGRIFFDDLGWPWPKHGCTDNPLAQKAKLTPLKPKVHRPFASRGGETLSLYLIATLTQTDDVVHIKFSSIRNRLMVLNCYIEAENLAAQKIIIDDLKKAPSFVIRNYDDLRLVEFISHRKKCVVAMKILKARRG